MRYLSYSIESRFVEDDGLTYYWAEFLFVDDNDEQWGGSSPDYTRSSSDFHCLREGALEAHHKLQAGKDWEDVSKGFRQSW